MKENNMQEIIIKVKLTNNFKIDEPFLYEILNGLGDHLVPVNEISLNEIILFDNKDGFHKENLKGSVINGKLDINENNLRE